MIKGKYFFEIAGKTLNKSQARKILSMLLRESSCGEDIKGINKKVARSFYFYRFGEYPPKSTKFTTFPDGYGYKCLHFSHDGVEFDHFSGVKALNSSCQVQKGDILDAFRWAIYDQIKPLQIKGKHVDHIVPFHVLLSDFLRDQGLDLLDIQLEENYFAPNGVYNICNKSLVEKWKEYHKKYAKLRVITAEENLRKGGNEDLALYKYRKSRNETYDIKQHG